MKFPAFAAEKLLVPPYHLYDNFDRSFHEKNFDSADKFKTETSIGYFEFEVSNASQREQVLRRFAEDGHTQASLLASPGQKPLERIAIGYPDLEFAIVDMVVDKLNIRLIVFNANKDAYLVGIIAAHVSQLKKVGFIRYGHFADQQVLLRLYRWRTDSRCDRSNSEHDQLHAGCLK